MPDRGIQHHSRIKYTQGERGRDLTARDRLREREREQQQQQGETKMCSAGGGQLNAAEEGDAKMPLLLNLLRHHAGELKRAVFLAVHGSKLQASGRFAAVYT